MNLFTSAPGPAPRTGGRPSPRVFINYRTSDEPFGAALIDAVLCARYGADRVFFASRSIRPGEDFAERILTAVASASVLLAVIGPRWLDAVDDRGRPCLDDPGDWVRREITDAFRHGVHVVPVLLNVNLPAEHQLPPPLARLSAYQYVRLHHRQAAGDLDRLATALDAAPAPAPTPTLTDLSFGLKSS